MKVRPSVKKICEKCKVIRRHGSVARDLREPPSQAAPGLKEKIARWHVFPASTSPARSGWRFRSPTSSVSASRRRRSICADTGLNPNERVRNLTEDEVNKIRVWVDANITVEGDLRRDVAQDIKRKIEIGCLQGVRHRKGLPVRGQRTHTNARTRKGPKKTVANKKKAVRK